MSFCTKIKHVHTVHDLEKEFRIFESNGNNYLEKYGKKYLLPTGKIVCVNNEYFISGEQINIDSPEKAYKEI